MGCLNVSKTAPIAMSREHDNESSGDIKGWKPHDQFRNYQILKKNCVP
jgi:hypothetical protein